MKLKITRLENDLQWEYAHAVFRESLLIGLKIERGYKQHGYQLHFLPRGRNEDKLSDC